MLAINTGWRGKRADQRVAKNRLAPIIAAVAQQECVEGGNSFVGKLISELASVETLIVNIDLLATPKGDTVSV